MNKKEKVLVLENRHIKPDDTIEDYVQNIRWYGYFKAREAVENDTSLRQIIPYVVIKHNDMYFVSQRLGGDERLKGQYSIGTGGHVNLSDCVTNNSSCIDLTPTVHQNIFRELLEETTLDDISFDMLEHIGVFVDDSNDVSKVHSCLLYVLYVDKQCAIREKNKLNGYWLTKDELFTKIDDDKLESWSKIARKMLFGNYKPAPIGPKVARVDTTKPETVTKQECEDKD